MNEVANKEVVEALQHLQEAQYHVAQTLLFCLVVWCCVVFLRWFVDILGDFHERKLVRRHIADQKDDLEWDEGFGWSAKARVDGKEVDL